MKSIATDALKAHTTPTDEELQVEAERVYPYVQLYGKLATGTNQIQDIKRAAYIAGAKRNL